MHTRPALPSEARALTDLLRRAKAAWNYPTTWLQAWESELTISADYIAREHVQVLVGEGEWLGFYALELRRSIAVLEHLWIEPAHMRRGLGGHLLQHACAAAQATGHHSLELVADPNATAFYVRHGAVGIGWQRSHVLGHLRVLPRLRLSLSKEHGTRNTSAASCGCPSLTHER